MVTGMGVVTPIGSSLDKFWDSLSNGRSGAGPITLFDTTGYPTTIACEVKDYDPEEWGDRKEIRRMDRFVQFALGATGMALRDSGLTIDESNATRVGVLIGSGIGGLTTMSEQHQVLMEKGHDRVSPFFVPMMISDMAAGLVSIQHGAKGPNMAISTACATSSHSIGEAAHIILRGDADAMIAGGAEATVCEMGVAGFCAMKKALSRRNDEPERASRPFDAERDGFVIAEGAGIVILEELEFAKARGATIVGEVIGYGLSADAYHITAPDPEGDGAVRSMQGALDRAGIGPADVDYINAHGTSTPYNDKIETSAIKKVFGDQAFKIPVSSSKSMFGHMLGAAGAVELISCLLAMRNNVIPPTINYENPDPECDLDYVPNTAREQKIDVAMSNSFGFGGHNATLVARRYTE